MSDVDPLGEAEPRDEGGDLPRDDEDAAEEREPAPWSDPEPVPANPAAPPESDTSATMFRLLTLIGGLVAFVAVAWLLLQQ